MRVSYLVFATTLAAAVPACNFEVHDYCGDYDDDGDDDHCYEADRASSSNSGSASTGGTQSSSSSSDGSGGSSSGSDSSSSTDSDTGSSDTTASSSGSGGSSGSNDSSSSGGGGEAGAGPDTCDDCSDPEPSECLWGESEMSSCCDVTTLAEIAEQGCAAYELDLRGFSLEDPCEDAGHTRVRYQCCL